MRISPKYFILLVLLVMFHQGSISQNLISVINKTEKTVFTIEGYSNHMVSGGASGFFISADGIAITKASLFNDCDSVVVTTRNGKSYSIEHIISVHPYANLALIKVKQRRQRDFSYLQTSRKTLIATHEVLIFSHPQETEKGISVDVITKIGTFPFVERYGEIITKLGPLSYGAPVINKRGLLIGINVSDKSDVDNIIYSSYLLNDSLWVNVNLKIGNFNSGMDKHKYLNPYLSRGMLNLLSDRNVEAAKMFSKYMKHFPDSYNLYCLRALARFRYNNNVGGREDIEYAERLNRGGFLAHYFNGIQFIESDKKRSAYECMNTCLDLNPEFIPAKVEHARLEWTLNNKIREAFDEFNEVIEMDSLNGDAYYERARLSFQFSSNKELAFEDLNRAIYLDPSQPGVFSLRGVMKLSKQDFLSAINDFTKAIEYDKNDVHAYFNRGIAHFNIGMKKSACKDWKVAGDLGNYSAFKYISRYCSK